MNILKMRHKKLQALKNRMQKNAVEEFKSFQQVFEDIRRPIRKMQYL